MNSLRQQQWQAILDKTRHLHTLAVDDQWEDMPAVEAERQKMIESFFASDVSEEEAGMIAEGIRQIMQSDNSLANMAAELKSEAVGKLTGIANVKHAVKAYDNCR